MQWIDPRDRYISDDNCLYREDLPPPPLHPALGHEITADVCIVGGGFTGLNAALALARAGRKVVLLERHRVGWGASGRNSGQLLPGFNLDIRDVERLYGRATATQSYAATVQALEGIKARITENKLDCSLANGVLVAATKPKTMADLAASAAYLNTHCNRRTTVHGGAETAALIGTQQYHGALEDPDGASFNPLQYLMALAQWAVDAGVQLYEETPAMQLAAGKKPVVHTPNGKVVCDHVVLAGGAYQGYLVPQLRRQVLLMRTSMLATAVLPENLAQAILPRRHAVYELRHMLSYFAKTADNRLIFGGGDCPLARNERERQKAFHSIRRRMVALFPQLDHTHITHWWGGYIAITRHELPSVGTLCDGYANIHYAHGYSGHGVVASHMVGESIAAAICGEKTLHALLQQFKAADIPGRGRLDVPLARVALLWYRLLDALG